MIDTPWDSVTDFSADPTIASVRAGDWSNPATWNAGRVPADNDRVWVRHRVKYGLAQSPAFDTVAVRNRGLLLFATDRDTQLRVTNLLVLFGGTLEVGSPILPVRADCAAEIVFRDVRPLDEKEYGTGLLAWGKVTMCGAAKTPHVRAVGDMLAGADTLTITPDVVGWEVGDRLLIAPTAPVYYTDGLPESDYKPEVVELLAVSGDRLTVTPVAWNHLAGRDGAGNVIATPHVANLNRNVVLRSENPAGTRGHTFFTYRSDLDLDGVLFGDLGRTTSAHHLAHSQIGRYAFHAHHLMGRKPDGTRRPQYRVRNCVVDGATKWGMASHDSHYGEVAGNVVYDCEEAGIVTEDGSESYNTFADNLVCGVGHPDAPLADGFWLKGVRNHFERNAACGIARPSTGSGNTGTGFHIDYLSLGPTLAHTPLFPGADTSLSHERAAFDPARATWMAFHDNEAYACDLGIWDDHHWGPLTGKLIRGFTAWNCHGGLGSIYGGAVTFDDVRVYGALRHGVLQQKTEGRVVLIDFILDCPQAPTGYLLAAGAGAAADYLLEDGFIRAAGTGVHNCFINDVGGEVDKGLHHKTLTLRDVRIDAPETLRYDPNRYGVPSRVPVLRDEFLVYDHQGFAGDSFRIYLDPEQRPEYVVPATMELPSEGASVSLGAPAPGQTNAQWSVSGWCVGGAVAPCAARRAGIAGLVCPVPRSPLRLHV